MSIQDNAGPSKDKGRLRKTIRKKVVELLKNNTDVGPRVFPNASVPTWEEELPVILIYPRAEPITEYGSAPREYQRGLDLAIEIIAKGPEVDEEGNPPINQKSLEDILDDIVEQVECVMEKDDTLGGVTDETILQNIEFEFEGAGGVPVGSARLTYEVTYYTMAPRSLDKQAGVSDFKKIEAEWNIGEDPDTKEATDSLDIPQT